MIYAYTELLFYHLTIYISYLIPGSRRPVAVRSDRLISKDLLRFIYIYTIQE